MMFKGGVAEFEKNLKARISEVHILLSSPGGGGEENQTDFKGKKREKGRKEREEKKGRRKGKEKRGKRREK